MVALYTRVSTAEQALNGYSIDEQIDRTQKYCQALGWSPTKPYTDAGFSGGSTERPALQQMIRDVKSGKIERVVVYKLDRLSRSQLDTLFLIEKVFLANGCDFVSISENFDTGTPFGRAMIGILAVFAQLEREQITERMKMGKEARAKLGKFHGSAQVPIGYDYIDGELVTNEFEKAQVVRIYEQFAEGIRPPAIAKQLNAAGMTHKNGKWLYHTVRQILSRKTYLGYSFYNGNWYKGTHEAFISQELFDKVQRLRERYREETLKKNRRPGKANSYLAGFVYCAHCGEKFMRKTTRYQRKDVTNIYTKYTCGSRSHKNQEYNKDPNCKNKIWDMKTLDNLVFSEIKKLALDPSRIEKKSGSGTEEHTAIASQITEIESKMSKLIDLYSDGEIPKKDLQKRIHDLNDQKDRLTRELERISAEQKKLTAKQDILPAVKSFEDILNRGHFEEIRDVLGILIDRITIDNDNVEITWRF